MACNESRIRMRMQRKYECTFHTLKNPELSSKTSLNPDNIDRKSLHCIQGGFFVESPPLVEGEGRNEKLDTKRRFFHPFQQNNYF